MPPWAPSIADVALSWGTIPAWLRYLIAFLIPLVATLILTPMAGRLAGRFDVMDRPGGHKTHLGATPYLGGLAVAGGLLLVGWLSAGASGQLLVVVGGALVLGFVGLLDDVQPVSPWIRLAYQVVAAIALWLVGVRAGVFDATWVDLPITVLWVVAVTNAFNFIDNMDGIAAGVATASGLGIAAIAGYNGDYLVTSLALATSGAALGFLRYNIPPARIFLGDAGSMLLGFMIAALILKLDLPVGPPAPRVLSTVLLAGVPLFDLSVVVIARLRDRRPIWHGSTDHTSHRMTAAGRSRRHVLVYSIAAQLTCSVLAYIVYRQTHLVVMGVGIAVGATWLVLLWTFLRMPGLTVAVDPTIAEADVAPG
jgi:UDP-GlcNAc:undecaprenyl-phosphate/decaprenyl-phosphate GlcNAc-1-phosphate transferase